MATKIVCVYCGGEYEDNLTKCPYCDSTNIKGAEAAYMEQLEEVRSDLEDLTEVPVQETKVAARRLAKSLIVVLAFILFFGLVCAGVIYWMQHRHDRDVRKDYLWQAQNYPVMQEMYDAGKYDELAVFMEQAVAEDRPVWEWGHCTFVSYYKQIRQLKEDYKIENLREIYSQGYCGSVFYDALRVQGMEFEENLTEEDKEILEAYAETVKEEFRNRWEMSDEEYESFYQKLRDQKGYIAMSDCDEYIEKWYKGE